MRARRSIGALAATLVALTLGGCASLSVEQNFQAVQEISEPALGTRAQWHTSDDDRQRAQAEVDRLLARPLSAEDAVRIALTYSPALQTLLSENAAASAGATQSARLPNPVFKLERLVKDGELDIERSLSFGLLDLVLLPARMQANGFQQEQLKLQGAADVIQVATEARQAWVRAVAAQQALTYFEQVKTAADAGAELARRMQAAGSFSKLQRTREQAFYADATAQLARARHGAAAAREGLIRTLGLNDAQAKRLQLPPRLPELPGAPADETTLARTAFDQRLDVRMARASLDRTAKTLGLTRVTSVIDGLHLGVIRGSETGEPPKKGFELEFPLPLFDFGDAHRAGAQATYTAALQRTAQTAVDARSQVRESYGAYRTAYDLAKHYRDEIVPLRKTIADEMLLKYNGMLIGVFELLADAREQVSSVIQALAAERDFWLADAALQAALIGKPVAGLAMEAKATAAGGGGGH